MSSATHQYLLRLIHDQLNVSPPLRVVDYGCGDGEFMRLPHQLVIKSYAGFDVSRAALAKAKQQLKGRCPASFTLIDVKHLPALGKASSIDLIVCIGVLQYLQPYEVEHFLAEVKRVLKKGGLLVISCAVDHLLYRWLDLYRLVLPHRLISRPKLLSQITKHRLTLVHQQEKGLILTPFFSHVLVVFFDAIDKLFLRTKGELGLVGRTARKLFRPISLLEFQLPVDYGYTLMLAAQK